MLNKRDSYIYQLKIQQLKELNHKSNFEILPALGHQMLDISGIQNRESRNFSLDTNALSNHPQLVNPLSAFVAKSGYNFSQLNRSKQKRIIIIQDSARYKYQFNKSFARSRAHGFPLEQASEFPQQYKNHIRGATRAYNRNHNYHAQIPKFVDGCASAVYETRKHKTSDGNRGDSLSKNDIQEDSVVQLNQSTRIHDKTFNPQKQILQSIVRNPLEEDEYPIMKTNYKDNHSERLQRINKFNTQTDYLGKSLRQKSEQIVGHVEKIGNQIKSMFDHDRNKSVLQSILTGMQNKIVDIYTENHMKIFGLHIKAFKQQEIYPKKDGAYNSKIIEDNSPIYIEDQIQEIIVSEQQMNDLDYIEQVKQQNLATKQKSLKTPLISPQKRLSEKQKNYSLSKQNRSSSPGKNKNPNSASIQNFKFSMMDYSQLSREQLFILKLSNYHQFIFTISMQSQFYVIPVTVEGVMELKVRVGRGNNSKLIKDQMKNRWWLQLVDATEQEEQINFLWTQLRVPSYTNLQHRNRQNHQLQAVASINSESASTLLSFDQDLKNQNKLKTQKKIKSIEMALTLKQQQESKLERFGFYEDPLHKLISKEQTQIVQGVENTLENHQKYSSSTEGILVINNNQDFKVHNHFQKNFYLGNKKALFYNLCCYYEMTKQNVYQHIPLTFHIQRGVDDPEYHKFYKYYRDRQQQIKEQDQDGSLDPQKKMRNVWIVKPGEFTNRGMGIIVCDTLKDINRIISRKQVHSNAKPYTFIVQEYLDKPFLYKKRKFDLRCYMLLTCLNGVMRGYWYEEGYLRTSCEEFSFKDCSNQYVHLTNDAIQKYSDDYGKYEQGNKLSFQEFQRYLELWHGDKLDFYKQIYPQMKIIATNSLKSVYPKIDLNRKEHNFEIFGLDFMIDEGFQPWLIEINTNPCLELSCPLLARLIPQMLENALKLSLDLIYPPPASNLWPASKKHLLFYDNILENNRFQLIFDQHSDSQYILQQSNLMDQQIDEMDELEEEYNSDTEEKRT